MWATAAAVGSLYHAALWLASLVVLLWDVCCSTGNMEEPASAKWTALDARFLTGLLGITVSLCTTLSTIHKHVAQSKLS